MLLPASGPLNMLLPHQIAHISSSLPGTPFIRTSKWMFYSHKIGFITVVFPGSHGTFRILNSVYNYIIINMVVWLMASFLFCYGVKAMAALLITATARSYCSYMRHLVNVNWTSILPVLLMLWVTWFFFLFSESLQSSSSVDCHLSRTSRKWSFMIVKKVWSQTTHAHTHERTQTHTHMQTHTHTHRLYRRKAHMGKTDVFIVPQVLIQFGIFSQKETCFLYHT